MKKIIAILVMLPVFASCTTVRDIPDMKEFIARYYDGTLLDTDWDRIGYARNGVVMNEDYEVMGRYAGGYVYNTLDSVVAVYRDGCVYSDMSLWDLMYDIDRANYLKANSNQSGKP